MDAPATLNAALDLEPAWFQFWRFAVAAGHFGALPFVVGRDQGRWVARPIPALILASFFAAGTSMRWLYAVVGYVRLLGIVHIVFWLPCCAVVVTHLRRSATTAPCKAFLRFYIAVVGLCLAWDVVNLVRHFLGDGDLLHRIS